MRPTETPPPTTHLRARFSKHASDAFFADVRARVGAYLRTTRCGRYDDGRIALKGGLYAALTVGTYVAILFGGLSPLATFAAATVFGLGCLMLGLNVAHDAAHNCLNRRRWLNLGLQTLIFTLLGADAYLWRLRHVKSHHVFPNVNDCDIDIDDYWWIRLSPNQPRLPHHRFQHIYASLIYWLVNMQRASTRTLSTCLGATWRTCMTSAIRGTDVVPESRAAS